MKKAITLAIFTLGIILTGCGRNSDAQKFASIKYIESQNTKYSSFLEKADEYYQKCGFNGCILVAQGDEIVLAKGYGISDLNNEQSEPITCHSTFEAGSITKQFTAAGILKLEEEGKLKTTDCLSTYYPDYKYGGDITIDMLLHMRSGLADHIDAPFGFYPEDVAQKVWDAELNGTELPKDITISYFEDVPLTGKPDEHFTYCNLNYRLLADIIEKVSGQDYDSFIQNQFFDPIGMKESNLNYQDTSTVGYECSKIYYSIPKATVLGAGDLNTTVFDLYFWDKALIRNEVLSEEQTKKMFHPIDGYGCGVFNNGDTILHGGSTDVFNSYNIVYPKEEMIIIVLINKPLAESSSTAIANNTRMIWLEAVE
ncbi:MAG: serine hydrolase [bacterium]|nr:serine hydrolase [bacterium]